MGRAAVEQIVAVDHGQDHVAQLELGNRARHVLGLTRIDGPARVAGRDRAETAAARARVTEQHHGGRARSPALAHIRTARFLADRVQIELTQRLLDARVVLTAGRAHLQPRGLRVVDLECEGRGQEAPPSNFSNRSLTSFGFAEPPVSFMAWPTKKPMSPFFPPRMEAAWLGYFSISC